MQTIKQRRVKVADYYSANGYGRGINHKTVYLIDGYYYAYHPKYANQAFESLTGEFTGYIPVNQLTSGEHKSYYECNPSKEGYNHHIPAKSL